MARVAILSGRSPRVVPDVAQQGSGDTGMCLPILMAFPKVYGFAGTVARTAIVLSA
jgi:hypothetical protein